MDVLLAHGADANLKTESGNTPLDFARSNGQNNIVDMLERHNKKLEKSHYEELCEEKEEEEEECEEEDWEEEEED